MATSVLIALREPFVRIGIEQTLRDEPSFSVIGHVDELGGIVGAVGEHLPDVLILDSSFQQSDESLMAAKTNESPTATAAPRR